MQINMKIATKRVLNSTCWRIFNVILTICLALPACLSALLLLLHFSQYTYCNNSGSENDCSAMLLIFAIVGFIGVAFAWHIARMIVFYVLTGKSVFRVISNKKPRQAAICQKTALVGAIVFLLAFDFLLRLLTKPQITTENPSPITQNQQITHPRFFATFIAEGEEEMIGGVFPTELECNRAITNFKKFLVDYGKSVGDDQFTISQINFHSAEYNCRRVDYLTIDEAIAVEASASAYFTEISGTLGLMIVPE